LENFLSIFRGKKLKNTFFSIYCEKKLSLIDQKNTMAAFTAICALLYPMKFSGPQSIIIGSLIYSLKTQQNNKRKNMAGEINQNCNNKKKSDKN